MRRRLPGPLILLLLASCGGGSVEEQPVETRVERGPVTLTVRAERSTVTVGEKLELLVEVSAEAGVEVELDDLDEEFAGFHVRPRTPDPVEAAAVGLRRTWDLDTFAAGETEIPPITVRFTDARPETIAEHGEPVRGEIASEPIPVTILTVLDDEEPGAIKSAVDVPIETTRTWWWLLVVGGVIAAAALIAGIVARLRRRRAATPTEPVIPAHVWAMRELERLEARKGTLIAEGRFAEFYFALSDIVRQYIERRFGLMAPERTTEEFLRELQREPVLSEGHKTLLGEFLKAADMVKFARFEPTVDQTEGAFDAARGFVRETTPEIQEAAA